MSPGNRAYRLVLEDGGDALLGLLDLALEGGLEVPQLGKLLAAVGLLDVELGDAALVEAGELNRLGGHLAVGNLRKIILSKFNLTKILLQM